MIKQKTLKYLVNATGIGLHSGKKIKLTLHPAPVNTGIIFRRVDLDEVVEIPANLAFVSETKMCTCIAKDGVKVSTIEHLMAAFAGLGVDNVYVDLSADEVPIMDGSSAPFIFLLQSAGLCEQQEYAKYIQILSPIKVQMDNKSVELLPYNGFKVSFGIDFNHPVFDENYNYCAIDFTDNSFIKDVSRARTFGFVSEYEYLKANNLALGGSINNAIVVDDTSILNKDGLRYHDEFIKHKILDAIGDLYLLGHRIIGEFKGLRSGHYFNNLILKEMIKSPESWRYVAGEELSDINIPFGF